MLIHRISLICSLALSALCLSPAAQAAHGARHTANVQKVADPEIDEPDTTGALVTQFSCEMGNRVTIYNNTDDDQHIALRWNRQLHRLTRVDTSTGAVRFENRHFGMVWIDIRAKGMLLDSKQNHQLANECKSIEPDKQSEAAAVNS